MNTVAKLLVAGLGLAAAPAAAYDEAERAKVFEDFPQMPPLGVFKMPQMTPKLFRTFLNVNDALSKEGAFEYVGPIEREVINTVTSAINNCEICLSFHTSSLARRESSLLSIVCVWGG